MVAFLAAPAVVYCFFPARAPVVLFGIFSGLSVISACHESFSILVNEKSVIAKTDIFKMPAHVFWFLAFLVFFCAAFVFVMFYVNSSSVALETVVNLKFFSLIVFSGSVLGCFDWIDQRKNLRLKWEKVCLSALSSQYDLLALN
jgi:hypothetical protein